MFDGIIDISHYESTLDLNAAKSAGIVAVIHKATEGATYQDPMYASRRSQAQSLGLLWGAYHFGTAADVNQQIQNFVDTANFGANDLVALDYEVLSGDQMTLAQAEEFVTTFQSTYGFWPLIYGSNLLTSVPSTSPLANCGLWIAQYADETQPSLPPAFTSYALWQFTDGTNPQQTLTAGVACDRNRYNGMKIGLMAAWPFR